MKEYNERKNIGFKKVCKQTSFSNFFFFFKKGKFKIGYKASSKIGFIL